MSTAWVSFDEIKKAVSLEMVIHHYGIELRNVSAGTLRGKCPLPMHGTDHKNRASFTATLTKGTGGVWACQSTSCIAAREGKRGGNALDLAASMEGCSIRDAAIKLAEWFGVPHTLPPHKTPKNETALKQTAQLVSRDKSDGVKEGGSNKPLAFTLQKIDHAHAYLKDRGITEETARNFGIGVFGGRGSMQGRCVIPIHNSKGELVAYAGRSIDGSEPKYKFPVGFHKSLELFNVHRVQKGEISVVLVEGFFDCIKVTHAGYPCVALMGSTMSHAQEELIAEGFAEVVLMLDGDEAGRGAAEGIEGRLQRRVFQVKTVWLPDGVQPDLLSVEELQNILRPILG